MYKITNYKQGKMRRDMEQLSKSNTLIARMRNLLDERNIDLPPSIEDGVEEQLENYEKYLDLKIQSKARKRREDLEAVERAIELLEKQKDYVGYGMQTIQNLRYLRVLKNDIEEDVQRLESLEASEVLADPNWE